MLLDNCNTPVRFQELPELNPAAAALKGSAFIIGLGGGLFLRSRFALFAAGNRQGLYASNL
jgi:hypothetical protein